MAKKLLIVVLVVLLALGGFAGYVAVQPPDWSVARSATMAAPPAAVFAQVNDFHQWDHWSPWKDLDPNAKVTFEGPSAGPGAKFHWAGNDEIGEGSMTILESKPNELIRIKLDFIKPFEDTATVDFTFKPEGDKTNVTYAMYGKNNFVGRVMCLFMNMDKMVGGKLEEALTNIKSVVEAKKAAATP